ncbi:hypothetical protein Vqi01_49720 [Micromonospora qiuiae]|uniref:Uncharacterized protein n=1 Tax=Micromonospora qiuiae TaxID=502268 RepID=A0ABQ4JHF4_9ACTN|nr:hypothetical protein Vqi01_49720 [Micromonospora qiuiae]
MQRGDGPPRGDGECWSVRFVSWGHEALLRRLVYGCWWVRVREAARHREYAQFRTRQLVKRIGPRRRGGPVLISSDGTRTMDA